MQFTAVPWMRDHLSSQIERLSETIEPTKLLDDGLKRLSERRSTASVGQSLGSGAACSRSSARPSSARSWTS